MKKSIAFLSAVSFLGGVLGRGLSYLLSVLLGRTVGAVGLGAFAVGFVVLRLGGSIAALGMDTAAQKFIPTYLKDDRKALVTGTSISLLVVPLLFGFLLAFGVRTAVDLLELYSGPSRMVVLTLAWGIPFLGIIHTAVGVSKAYKETIYEVIINQIIRPIGAIVLVLGAYVMTDELGFMADAYLISIIIASVSSALVLQYLGVFEKVRSANVELRQLLKYSIPVTVVSISYPLIVWTDILLLGYFVSGGVVGQYQASYQTASLLTFALVSVNAIYPSVASEMYSNENYDGLSVSFSSITKWIASLSLFAGFYEIIFAKDILQLFGNQFAGAHQLLVVLAIGQISVCVVGPTGYLLSMAGHERLETVNTVTMAIVNLILNIIFIQRWGAIGAAAATSISISALNIARLIEIWWWLNIQPYDTEFLRTIPGLVTAAASMIIIDSLDLPYIYSLIIGGSVSGILFLLLMGAVAFSSRDMVILDSVQNT